MKFTKRPVTIEAVQFTPDPAHPRDNLPEGVIYSGTTDDKTDHHWFVRTLEGQHRATPGDWIITGVAGERYPCKPDIFDRTYGPASIDTSAIDTSAIRATIPAIDKIGIGALCDEVDRLRAALALAKEPPTP